MSILQGPIESISVGEIKPSLRRSLVKLGVGFISKDPKLQVLICDLEVVMRPSSKSTPKAKAKAKSGSRKTRNSGRGKWMVGANIARYLSVSITDLILKVCSIGQLSHPLYVDETHCSFFKCMYVFAVKNSIEDIYGCIES